MNNSIISQLLSKLSGQVPNFSRFGMAGIVITLVFGLLFCFFGYRFLKFFVALIGFAVGAGIGTAISIRAGGNGTITLILALIFGIALGVVSFFIYKAGIFILAGGASFGLLYFAFYEHMPSPWPIVIAAAGAVLIGILALLFVRPMVILTSGLGGGLAFSAHLIGDLIKWDASYANIVIAALGIALGILGIIFQFKTTREKKR